MRNRFDRQLSTLNDELIEMGSMIEKSIETAIKALVNQDVDLARHAIEADEEIDRQERIIEDLCLKLLLQQQPVAKDLRLISSALKMITDMERIGDHASDISEITIALADQPYIKKLEHIQQMAKETMIMLVGSIGAFVDKDLEKANEVIKRDDVVDDLFDKVKKELIQMIHENADKGEQAADLLMVAKYMERIGDHATNISEWVIFSITGEHKSMN
ncbi:MAG: phosphate signaling complex protein PhoU [Lachnospira sp.]